MLELLTLLKQHEVNVPSLQLLFDRGQEKALKLAEEQYAYCPDIVEQGVGTIEALAAGLLEGTAWYFWWD